MTTPSASTKVRMSWLWDVLITLAGLVIGVIVGFLVPVLGDWATNTVHIVPGPLKVAMNLPPAWVVPVCSILGLIGGLLISDIARKESLKLDIAADHVELSQEGRERFVPRAEVAEVFREGKELVLIDRAGARLARFKADDLNAGAIEAGFREHGYPWRAEDDPYASHYTRWIDGKPDVDDEIHRLLRARRHARGADKKVAELGEIDAQLLERGIDARDRDDEQQIRRFGPAAPMERRSAPAPRREDRFE
ncbi:hypothetical protein D5S18_33475 [Nocardia panacis]|uniref:DUF308 domain-containing protein n=1 Tax=Nocardia panacis TaxID=2340916 RepID=A0A3A4K6N1_9NOCA|nr:hypothetical protein [Nocardia panacis]RJO68329.1 hypothetical protein D5S18_33475 [Nocardia panacis]